MGMTYAIFLVACATLGIVVVDSIAAVTIHFSPPRPLNRIRTLLGVGIASAYVGLVAIVWLDIQPDDLANLWDDLFASVAALLIFRVCVPTGIKTWSEASRPIRIGVLLLVASLAFSFPSILRQAIGLPPTIAIQELYLTDPNIPHIKIGNVLTQKVVKLGEPSPVEFDLQLSPTAIAAIKSSFHESHTEQGSPHPPCLLLQFGGTNFDISGYPNFAAPLKSGPVSWEYYVVAKNAGHQVLNWSLQYSPFCGITSNDLYAVSVAAASVHVTTPGLSADQLPGILSSLSALAGLITVIVGLVAPSRKST
jgi:hypothetical protein